MCAIYLFVCVEIVAGDFLGWTPGPPGWPVDGGFIRPHPSGSNASPWIPRVSSELSLTNDTFDGKANLVVLVYQGFGVLGIPHIQISPEVIHVSCGEHEVSSVVNKLKSVPGVVWIERRKHAKLMNLFSRSTIGSWKMGVNMDPFDWPLTGKGQLVGVGDTGLDYNSCYFSDDVVPPTMVRDYVTTSDNGHRKIRAYWGFMDYRDGDADHGTHVSGTVAGQLKPSRQLSAFNGIAPDSRIVFTDLVCQSSGGCAKPSNIPESVWPCAGSCAPDGYVHAPLSQLVYLSWFYAQGARISSNSWGGSSMEYTVWSSRFDDAVKQTNMLVLFAAGNANMDPGHLLGDTCNAKNVLCVGASSSGSGANKFIVGNVVDYNSKMVYMSSYMQQHDGCTPTDTRQTCVFYRSLTTSAQACATTGLCGATTQWCGCNVASLKGGVWNVGEYACPSCVYNVFVSSLNSTVTHVQSMAQFSSRGPNKDNRIKPDVVAPGDQVASSRSYTTLADRCGFGKTSSQSWAGYLTPMSGTSMATPIVAGYAALIREWLATYYPNPVGITLGATPISDPPASLMKALIINSAEQMTGLYWNAEQPGWVQLATTYQDFVQGFGLVQMERLIARNVSYPEPRTLVLAQENIVLSTGQSALFSYTMYCSYLCDLSITMAYTDLQGTPGSTTTLVNDLDLTVAKGPQTWRGNFMWKLDPDRINNVEKVIIRDASPGIYTISVNAFRTVDPQSFSIVATATARYIDDACPIGTSIFRGGCLPCRAGTFTSAKNSLTCLPCPIGTFSDVQSGFCQPCQSGTYACEGRCISCSPGTFSAMPKSSMCLDCAAGTFSVGGASTCPPCPNGTFSDNAASSCTLCPAGTYSNGVDCIECQAGSYAPSGSSKCLACQTGSYSPARAGACLICPAGTISVSSGCNPCSAGFYSPMGSTTCTRCPDGSISPSGSGNCTHCQVGMETKDGIVCTKCSPGAAAVDGVCAKCPPGTFSGTTMTRCAPCPRGTYSTEGAYQCLTCPIGTYAWNGSDTCISCVPWTTSSEKSDHCDPCPCKGTTWAGKCVSCDTESGSSTPLLVVGMLAGLCVLLSIPVLVWIAKKIRACRSRRRGEGDDVQLVVMS